MSVVCPRCGTPLPPRGAAWCLPVGRALTLIGGLALVAAYFMPWFATQGIVLTGSFLGQFLGSTNDLRRFLPGSSGGQTEVQLLRALVYLFPASGVLAALLVGLGTVRSSLRTSLDYSPRPGDDHLLPSDPTPVKQRMAVHRVPYQFVNNPG